MKDELYFSVSVSRLPAASEKVELPIDNETLKLAALACDVVAFDKLEAKFRFKRWRKNGVTLVCDFRAEIEQECIATLEPVKTTLNENFERQFLPENSSDYKKPEIIDGEMILDPEATDYPDTLESDEINLWDVLIEELILVINPFPRANGLEAEDSIITHELGDDIAEEPTHKPFSDLKALITEKKSNK